MHVYVFNVWLVLKLLDKVTVPVESLFECLQRSESLSLVLALSETSLSDQTDLSL
tara:strand:+ start:279 stop:443 length:165 start_codon:yes stop_codon:yes gene_type:complete